jgi:Ca-activated chloride channel homolog
MKAFLTAAGFILIFALAAFAQKQAEVVVASTYLRQTPDYNAEKIRTLQKGERVTIEKAREAKGWFYVSVSTGAAAVKGWIRSETVRALTGNENASNNENAARIENSSKRDRPNQTSNQTAPQPAPANQQRVPPANNPPQQQPQQQPPPTANPEINSTPAAPQATPSATPETVVEDPEIVRVETEEVTLNVRVVDGNNRPVNNLHQADFKIFEDDVLQPITSLTTTEVPIINALVIDNSRSLRAQLKKVIEAGKIIVGTNKAQDESAIVRFVSSDKVEIVQDFTRSKTALNEALDNLFVEGGQTAIIDAVYRTAKKVDQYQTSEKKEDVKLRALILVSDGDDRGSAHSEQQLFKLLRESNVQIYAIGFVNDLPAQQQASAAAGQNGSSSGSSSAVSRQEKARAFLTRLAQETGGKVYFPNSIDELAQIAADISAELRTQYVISYSPTNENRDGSFRKIKVLVNEGAGKEKRTAITRTGRNAPAN